MIARKSPIVGFAFAVTFSSFVSLPDARAQDSSIVGELERLRRDMNTLQSYVFRGAKGVPSRAVSGEGGEFASQDAVSQLQLQIQKMRRLMREMNGQFEELQFKIKRNSERLDRLVADVDLRLRALEVGQGGRSVSGPSYELRSAADAAKQAAKSSGSGTVVIPSGVANEVAQPGLQPGQQAFGILSKRDLNQFKKSSTVTPASANPPILLRGASVQQSVRAAAVSKPVAAPAPAPVTSATAQTASVDAGVLPDGTPEEQYNHAHELMMKRKMSEAENALKAFLELHPTHELADNASYWLGETHYARENFQEAIRVYYDAYKTYPKGNKAPAVLLKLGMSLASIGEKESACSAYDELTSSHPKAGRRILGNASRMSKQLGCK
jgi:tol-pal system protein YbgF